MNRKHLYTLLVFAVLLLVYAVGASFLYRRSLESDLREKAGRLIDSTEGLDGVVVNFKALDATLSGEVNHPLLRDKAARLVASLPSVRVVNNEIKYTAPPPPKDLPPVDPPPPPPAPEPPPPPKPSSLNFVSTETAVALTGRVKYLNDKREILRPFALSGVLFELADEGLSIDPGVKEDDWPADLGGFLALLATRTHDARLSLTGQNASLFASALNEKSAAQIEQGFVSLDFKERTRSIDVSVAPVKDLPSTGFFLRARVDAPGRTLMVEGRLADEQAKAYLLQVLKEDLAGIEIDPQLTVANDTTDRESAPDDKSSGDSASDSKSDEKNPDHASIPAPVPVPIPEFASRLPNLVSLAFSRLETGRLSTNESGLRVSGEMRPGQNPADLTDLMRVMLGPGANLDSRIIPHTGAFAGPTETPAQAPPSTPPAAPGPDPRSGEARERNTNTNG